MAGSEIKMKMSLDSSGVKAALTSTGQRIKDFAQKGHDALNRVAKVSLVALGAGFTASAREALRLGREIENLSRVANSTPAEFQKMAHAAETVGISQEKLADQFKDFDERVGQYLNEGSGELQQFFEEIAPQVGVTADEFARLSGPEALQLYAKSLEEAGIQGKQFDEMLERTASDAKVLAPLLANGSAELKRLGREAEDNGLIMSDATSEALNKMSLALDRFKKKAIVKVGSIISGEANHAAIKQLGAQFMAKMAEVGGFVANMFIRAGITLKAAFTAAAESLWPQMKTGFKMLGLIFKQAIAPVVNEVVDMLNNIPGIKLPKMDVSDVESQLTELSNVPQKGFVDSFNEAAAGMADVKFEASDAVQYWENLANEQGEILKGAQGTAKATKETAGNVEKTKDTYKSIKELELDLQKAIADGDRMEEGAIRDQIELETLVGQLRKQGVTTREEALAIAEKILFNQKEMQRAEEALLDAQLEGNDALIHEEQKRLDLLKSIDDIMKSTGKSYDDALVAAKQLAAIKFGPDVNQSGFITPREQREFDIIQEQRERANEARRAQELRDERALGGGLLPKIIPPDIGRAERTRQAAEEKAFQRDVGELQRRMNRGDITPQEALAEIAQRRAERRQAFDQDQAVQRQVEDIKDKGERRAAERELEREQREIDRRLRRGEDMGDIMDDINKRRQGRGLDPGGGQPKEPPQPPQNPVVAGLSPLLKAIDTSINTMSKKLDC
jgi:hypothetical protein